MGQAEARRNPGQARLKKTGLEVQNLEQQPVYANDAKTGEKILTTQGAVNDPKSGLTNPIKVTEAQVIEDRQLNNRLADVQNKIDRYEQNLSGSLSERIAATLPDCLPVTNSRLEHSARNCQWTP